MMSKNLKTKKITVVLIAAIIFILSLYFCGCEKKTEPKEEVKKVEKIAQKKYEPASFNNPELIPENSFLVLSSNNLSQKWEAIKENPIYLKYKEIISDPTISDDINFQKFLLEKKKIETELGSPLDLETVMTKLLNAVEFSLALTDSKPAALLVCDVKDKELMGKIITLIENKSISNENEIKEEEYSGIKFKTISKLQKNLCYAEIGEKYIFTNGDSLIKNTIDRTKGVLKTSIKDHKYYPAKIEGLNIQDDFLVFFDYVGLMNSAKGMIPNIGMQKMMFGSLGNEFVMLCGGKINKDSISIDSYAPFIPESKTFNYNSFKEFKPAVPKILEYCPKNPLMLSQANTFSGELVYDSLLQGLAAFMKTANPQSQTNPEEQLKEQIAEFEKELGFNIKNDVLMNIGPEGGFVLNSFSMAFIGMPSIDLAIISQVKDTNKITSVMTKLEKYILKQINQSMGSQGQQGELTFKSEVLGKSTIKYLEIPMFQMYSPAYVIDGKNLIIALSKDNLKNYLNCKNGAAENYFKNPDYIKTKSLFGEEINSYFTLDIKTIVSTFKGIMNTLQAAQNRSSSDKREEIIYNALSVFKSISFASSIDEKGYYMKGNLIVEKTIQPSQTSSQPNTYDSSSSK